MFYVSSKKDELFGVVDTSDNSEEFYNKDSLLSIVRYNNIEIDGVDIDENYVCIVKPESETVRLFRQGKVHLALSTMTIQNTTFSISFKSKPTKGEMRFVSNRVLNVSRSGVNSFSFDLGYSKSYRSEVTLDDIMIVFEQFRGWTIDAAKVGRS